MKKFLTYFLSFVLLHMYLPGVCQQVDPGQTLDLGDLPPADAYAVKSLRQKSAATSLLVVGGLLFITPIGIAISSNPSFDDLETLAGVAMTGAGAALGSIPLFIASARNRRNAQAAKVTFQWQRKPGLQAKGFAGYPAFALRISL